MNARLDIKAGIEIRTRLTAERYQPTIKRTSAFHYVTDLDGYRVVLPSIGAQLFSDISTARTSGSQTTTHLSVRLDNPTHPEPAKGVIPLAKGHRDITMADGDVADGYSIEVALTEVIETLEATAKY
jgi:hypothetical protein